MREEAEVSLSVQGQRGSEARSAQVWSARSLLTVALCFAINMADGVDITILSFLAPAIQREWGLGAAAMGAVFGAGLLGMALGGMGLAPLADHHGRRRVILLALVLMSAGMLGGSVATSAVEFLVLRVLVGAGIGAVLAAMAALVAECAPAGHARLAVGLVQAGYPLAGVFTGLAVARYLPSLGWHWLLAGAGMTSAVLWPLAWALLDDARAARGKAGAQRSRLGPLFAPAYRSRTLALWGAVFCALMVLYFVVSWIPRLASTAGAPEARGLYAGAIYNLGAFMGTCAMSLLAMRLSLGKLVPAMAVAAALAMAVLGGLALPAALTLILVFSTGVLLQGGYNGLWPLAASIYPSSIRATGIGWAIGIGRGGAILGPLLGGYLMSLNSPRPLLFGLFCLPLLACALLAALAGRVVAFPYLQK
jgi:MFS family permease